MLRIVSAILAPWPLHCGGRRPAAPGFFELGVVNEVFGVDRTDDGVPAIDFRACSERPGSRSQMEQRHLPDHLPRARRTPTTPTSWSRRRTTTTSRRPRRSSTPSARRTPAAPGCSRCARARSCSGEAGLLDGRACTTHWRHTADLRGRFPLATVDPDVLFVEDDRMITSAGTAAGIDACLHHVRCELGAAVANTHRAPDGGAAPA